MNNQNTSDVAGSPASSPQPAEHPPSKRPKPTLKMKLALVVLVGGAVTASALVVYNDVNAILQEKKLKERRGSLFAGGFPPETAGREQIPQLEPMVERGGRSTPSIQGGSGHTNDADWPCFLGPYHNGTSSETGLVKSWPKSGPPVLWQKVLGSGYSAPSVGNGRAIVFYRLEDNEIVECLDARTGQSYWKVRYPTSYRDQFGFNNGPRSTPIIADNRVYTLGAQGQLLCLALDTGRVIWKRSINVDFDVPRNFFGVGTSPLLEGDLLLINVGGPNGAGLVAFHKDTGEAVWQATDEIQSYSTPVCATINDVRYAFFLTRSGLVCVAPENGALHWQYPFRSRAQQSVNAATPVVVGDLVFISAAYRVGAAALRVTADEPQVVWQDSQAMANHWATSIHHQGYLYGFTGRHMANTVFRCIELETGKKSWDYTEEHLGRGSMVMADGHFIILGEGGILLLVPVSPRSCEVASRAKVLDGTCFTAPVLAHGRLYLRGERKLLCLDLKHPAVSMR